MSPHSPKTCESLKSLTDGVPWTVTKTVPWFLSPSQRPATSSAFGRL